MADLDTLSPEQHRERYVALKAAATARLSGSRHHIQDHAQPAPINPADVILADTIPGGWYRTLKMKRGTSLRIVNPQGRSAVSTLIWNAEDTAERYNAGDTVKIQWNALLGAGQVLFSDMGRVLASITADSGAGHDALAGGSSAATNAAAYGAGPLRNTRDNFCLAAAKLGLQRRDIMPCISFFAPVRTTATGDLVWNEAVPLAGAYVDLRAEMNLILALSNCPHPLDPRPGYAPGPVEIIHWRSAPPEPGDPCRTGSEEAIRGFENTDPLFLS